MKRFIILLLLVLGLLAACNQASETKEPVVKQNEGVFVGSLEGTNALIAVVVSEGEVTAYSCGGDGTWSSHTAWFEGELNDGGFKLEESYGLKLSGTLTDLGVKGSLTLRDGAEVAFLAEPANAASAAGLYRLEDERGEAGLVISNDLQATGVFYGADASAARVTVTDVLDKGPKAQLEVKVNNKGEDLKLVLMPIGKPIKRPPPVLLNPEDAPKVIVLMHGMLLEGDREGIGLDEPRSARGYWLHEFVLGLLNGEKEAPLRTLAGTDVSNDNWYTEGLDEDSLGDAFVYADNGSWSDKRQAPPLSVMMTYRDSTVGVVQQSAQASEQIYNFYKWYIAKYKVQPQLILMGHSMGGLVARFIIGNPERADLARVSDMTTTELNLVTPELRDKMAFLRDRTNYLVTLSTPHEGTPFAEKGEAIIDRVLKLKDALEQDIETVGNVNTFFEDVFSELLERQVDLGSALFSKEDILVGLDSIVDLINPNTGQISDLTESFWLEMNRLALQPENARRGNDVIVPGAEGFLIPIYTVGGRSPGSRFFKTLDMQQIILDLSEEKSALPEHNGIQASAPSSTLVPILVDLFMLEFFGGWGESNQVFISSFSSQLDKVERFGLASSAELLYNELLELARTGGLDPSILFGFFGTGGLDTDAIVRYFESTEPYYPTQLPIYLSEGLNFEVDFDESIRIDVPFLVCSSLDTSFISENLADVALALSDYSDLSLALAETLLSQSLSFEDFLRLELDPVRLLETFLEDVTDTFREETLELLTAAATAAFDLITELGVEALECADLSNWELSSFPVDVRGVPKLLPNGVTARDAEVDSDGFVPYDSSMGLVLGGTLAPRLDHSIPISIAPNKVGSWYRLYDSPFEDYNHLWETRHQAPAVWLRETIINEAGPIAIQSGLSVYP